jgi:hypothetical protein
MAGVLGIDAAWTEKEPSGVALLEGAPGDWRCVAACRLYSGYISKTQRPPHPDLTVRLEAFYHHLPLGLILPKIPEDVFLIWVVLSDSLQAALHEALDEKQDRSPIYPQ